MEFKKIQLIAFFALLIGVSLLFFELVKPYLFAVFWAAVISALFYPVYARIKRATKRPQIAAFISVILVVLIVLIPLVAMLGLVVKQAIDTYSQINNPETIRTAKILIKGVIEHPIAQQIIGEVDLEQKLRSFSSTITSTGIEWLKVGSRNTISAIIQTFIMLYAAYYFFQEGPKWLQRLMHLLPFGDENEKTLYEKFVSTAKATLKGTVLLGIIQGGLGGVFFLITGIPSAAFWGLIMVVASIIPAVGPVIVWFPGVIYLLVTGQVWQGVVLLIGGLFIGVLDNLLRPWLVGKDIEMHPLMILFATIGGIALLGISGVVIGPMIASFFLAIVDMYEHRYRKQLEHQP